MRGLILALLAASAAWAQSSKASRTLKRVETVWDGGQPIQNLPLWRGPWRLGGGPDPLLPKELLRGTVRSWKGAQWAVGWRAHPAYARFRILKGFPDMVVYRRAGSGPWNLFARWAMRAEEAAWPFYSGTLPVDRLPVEIDGWAMATPMDLLALEDGTFLVWMAACGPASRGKGLARLHLDSAGRLAGAVGLPTPSRWTDNLGPTVGVSPAWERWGGCLLARSPQGILLVDATTTAALLLDNHDGHVLHCEVLFPDHAWQKAGYTKAILDVQPRADGSFLLVTPHLDHYKQVPDSWKAWQRADQRRNSDSNLLALARLDGAPQGDLLPEGLQTLHWFAYTPGSTGLQALPPPINFPTRVVTKGALYGFSFTFRPDGGLVLGPGLEARGTVVR